MRYFGEKLDAPIYDHAGWVSTPVGRVCWWCQNEIKDSDNGFMLPSSGPQWESMHRACLLRCVLGPDAELILGPARLDG